MQFDWSEEQLKLKNDIILFAEKELNEGVIEEDRNNTFPRDKWKKCADWGILGLCFPKEYGGKGYDILTTILMLEGLGYACKDNGLPYSMHSQMWSIQTSINSMGSHEQKDKFLRRLIQGELGAFGITEDMSGSDYHNLHTSAKKVDGGYILNGEKHFITLAPECTIAVVFASTAPERGSWGITAFIVEEGMEGFETGEVREKVGMRTTPMGNFSVTECFVPDENRLGPEGAGTSLFTAAMEAERGYIFASQVGRMEKQLEIAVKYARDRKALGNSIGKFQSVSNRIADMRLRLETSKMLMYKVAFLESQKKPVIRDAALAKLYISEAFLESSLDFIRIHGAKGVVSEYEIDRDMRDGLGGLIYSGTNDIQRNIIAKLEGL